MIRVSRDVLLSALSSAFSMVSAKSPKEILQCVSAEVVSPDSLRFHATNTESGIFFVTKVDSIEATLGTTLLFTQRAYELIKQIPCKDITVEVTTAGISIRSQLGVWKFNTPVPESFPPVPEPSGESVTFPAERFKIAVNRLASHIDEESLKYALGGVCFDFARNAFAATDSRSLGVVKCEFTKAEGALEQISYVYPIKSLRTIAREVTPSDEVISLNVAEGASYFQLQECTVYTRRIEGRFPDYTYVIPESSEYSCVVSAAEFKTAVKLAAKVHDKETTRVDFYFNANNIQLNAVGADIGDSTVNVVSKESNCDEVTVCLSTEYLQHCLAANGDTTIHLIDGDSPVRFEDGEVTCVLMPLSKG